MSIEVPGGDQLDDAERLRRYEARIAELEAQVASLREELRRLRSDRYEVPPHHR